MTTGEKLALLRKERGITQEELAETLNVSRQSVSRWEVDAAFPETDKLIKLSKLFECSIDYLLNESIRESKKTTDKSMSMKEYYQFIRECGYFFLATSVDNQPGLRPFGMIYSDDETLYISTDKRKKVYSELEKNPKIAIASYNPNTRKWIRISGRVETENSAALREEMLEAYPNLKQACLGGGGRYLVFLKLLVDEIGIA